MFYVGQQLHQPAHVIALGQVLDWARGIDHARWQHFVRGFIVLEREPKLHQVIAALSATRSLAGKRSLALREFALGIEALERFVRGEPLRRVHECVFGVLALESEPVDPRL